MRAGVHTAKINVNECRFVQRALYKVLYRFLGHRSMDRARVLSKMGRG